MVIPRYNCVDVQFEYVRKLVHRTVVWHFPRRNNAVLSEVGLIWMNVWEIVIRHSLNNEVVS
jgi:hypothetical protein